MLAKSKLNSIEMLEISHEKFDAIIKEKEKYEMMKQNMRDVSEKQNMRLNSVNSRNIMRSQNIRNKKWMTSWPFVWMNVAPVASL